MKLFGRDLDREIVVIAEVGVNHEDVILENNPSAVRGPANVRVALPEEHAGGELSDRLGRPLARALGDKQRTDGAPEREEESFHGEKLTFKPTAQPRNSQ